MSAGPPQPPSAPSAGSGVRARFPTEGVLTTVALPLSIAVTAFGAGTQLSGWSLALVILAWVPLLGRNRWPLPVLAMAAGLDTASLALVGLRHPSGTVGAGIVPIATILALYTVGNRYRASVTWKAAAVIGGVQFAAGVYLWFAAVILAAFRSSPGSGSAARFATTFLYLNWALVGAALGRIVHERRERIAAAEDRADEAERTMHAEAERQVIAERMRIARDLHDVLAHHVTVVNAQAGVAQYLLRTDPDAADKALVGIVENSGAALDELRITLGLLRNDDGDGEARSPAPSAAQLDALFATFIDGGADLTVSRHGTPRRLSGPADIAVYRIAQEALTNASKHAPGAAVCVELRWSEPCVELTVTNTCSPAVGGSATSSPGGTGHGLIGMRERATTAAGTLSFGATSAGGYRVTVTLPVVAEGGPE